MGVTGAAGLTSGWGAAGRGGRAWAGAGPDAGAGELCRAVSDVHELVAEGAVRGDRELLLQAVEADPAVADRDAGREAVELILAAHADILPRFSHGPAGRTP